MPWGASSGSVASATDKTSSTTFTTGAVTGAVNDVLVIAMSLDNAADISGLLPTITGITVPVGETATWVQLSRSNSQSATAGGGQRTEVWGIQLTQAWTAFQPVVTLSDAVAAKCSVGVIKSGGTLTPSSGSFPVSGSRSSIGTPSLARSVLAGDLVIASGHAEHNVAPPHDTDTTDGAWVQEDSTATTGSTANTNQSVRIETKVVTVAGTQTYNWSLGTSTDTAVNVFALLASNPTGQAALAGTGSITAGVRVGKVAGTALSGSGSISAAAVVGHPAGAALTGTGSITAAAAVAAGFQSSAALTGTGDLEAAATLGVAAAAALAGTGAISAAAVVGVVAEAALTGTGDIEAELQPIVDLPVTADLAGTGAITAAMDLSEAGALTADAELAGTGHIAASFLLTIPPQTVISPLGGRRRSGTASLHFDPALVPVPRTSPVIRSYIAAYAHAATQPAVTPYARLDCTLATRRRGRIRTTCDGVDISFWRGVPIPDPTWQLISPGLYGPGRLVLPQFRVGWDVEGEGDAAFLRPWAPVHVQLIDLDGTRHTLYKGRISDYDEDGGAFSCVLAGQLTGRAAIRDRQPPVFPRRRELAQIVLATVRSLRLPVIGPAEDTGITIVDSGGMKQSQWIDQTMAQAQKRDGTRWTLMPNADGVYELREKDTTTVHYTLYRDDARTVARVRRDFTEEPTSIYAEAIREDGLRIRNAVWPAVFPGRIRPPYPLADHDATLSEGATDADTDTGDGVTLMIWKLWDLGFVDILDVAEGIPDDWTALVTKGLRQAQRKSDLPVTGTLTYATWQVLWDTQGASLRGAKILPTSEDPRVRRWTRSASGQKLHANPLFDAKVETVDRSVQLGSFYDWDETQDIADQLRWDGETPNYVGNIDLPMGALIAGDHTPGTPVTADMLADALLAVPGENVKVVNLGTGAGTLANISAIDKSDTVSLTIDTRARDSMEVWEVDARAAETRHSLQRAWELSQRKSTTGADSVQPWDRLGGKIPAGISFDGARWNAFDMIMGKEGSIRDFDMTLEFQPTEYVVAVFGTHMHPRLMQQIIGDPFSDEGRRNWRRKMDVLKRRHLLLYAAGTADNPCGYFPSTKAEIKQDFPWRVNFADGTHQLYDTEAAADKAVTSHPGSHKIAHASISAEESVTGRFKDDAGFSYFVNNDTPGIGWVLVYPRLDTNLKPGRLWKPQLTDQA